MKKILLTRWIPCSGKTTFSKKEVKEKGAFHITKDQLRKEDWLFPAWYFYSKENEEIVYEEERQRVEDEIRKWTEYIIVDNTHLGDYNKHINYYKQLAKIYWYEFEIKDFYISREDAIARDKLREDSVWEDVINKMIKIQGNKWYPKNPTFAEQDITLPTAYIVDIDWTLAFMDDKRTPYEFEKVKLDRCNKYLKHLVSILAEWNMILIVSWREDSCRQVTEQWLIDNNIPKDFLFMRAEWDKRKDTIVKKEIYESLIKDKFQVLWVFDDRQSVCDMWRLELWLFCMNCWYWYF